MKSTHSVRGRYLQKYCHVYECDYRLLTADVPLPLGSRTVPVPLLAASNSNSSQELNRSSPLTNSMTNQLNPLHYLSLIALLITSLDRPHRQHCPSFVVQSLLNGPRRKHNSSVVCGSLLTTAAVQLPIPRSQRRNESTCHYILARRSDSRRGSGLDIGFIDQLIYNS
jgi:hypothetical protein